MPRFRFSIRGVMACVACIALTLGGSIAAMRCSRLAAIYRDRQGHHAVLVAKLPAHIARCRSKAEAFEHPARPLARDEALAARNQARWWRANEADAEARLAYHAAMERKYARASWSPWQAPGPDPPEPRWDGHVEPVADDALGPPEGAMEPGLAELRRLILDAPGGPVGGGGREQLPDPPAPK